MSDTFTRQELFDLVWSAPTRTVAKQLGISDVGLAKACRRANLLLSPRGYWAKIAAGKKAEKPQLPPRGPGMSDRIVLRPSRWGWGHDTIDLSTPDPPVPTFSETLDELAERLGREIGRVRPTRDLESAHPHILKLLESDEHRRARQRQSPYPTFDASLFDSKFEQRRLRVLNSLLRALERVDVSVAIDGQDARGFIAHVGDHSVAFTLDAVSKGATPGSRHKGRAGSLRCQLMSLCGGTEPVQSWIDSEFRLETRLLDIAVAIVIHGERIFRASAHQYREWVVQRKAELAEEQRRKEEERQRLERERLQRLEKARVARLLAQARALQEAQEIRRYVTAVQDLQPTLGDPLSEREFQDWVAWSLSQANRIDPVLNGSYRNIRCDD